LPLEKEFSPKLALTLLDTGVLYRYAIRLNALVLPILQA
jgi:hypothetical protein